jgi:iron complex outermembrane receptor protein
VGVDYQHIYGRAWYTNRETGDVVTTKQRQMQSAHAHENEVAGYVDFRQDLTSWLTVDAGLRYDHHSTAGAEWVPQFGVVCRALSTAELKASVSKGFRNPTTREMYLYGTANHDSLRAERLWNYELSWRHRLEEENFTYGINLFYIKADNLIQTVAGRNINTGEIENYGLELELSYALLPNLSITCNGSLLHMKNHVVGAPEQKCYLGLDYRCQKLTVNLGYQYVQNLYTAVGNDEQKERFNLISLAATYALTRNLSLWARGENLLAKSYEINLGYPMPRATFMGGINVSF